MKNVEMTVEGTMLTIRVDLSKEFGPSASGKTIIIASTEGNVTIPNREEKSVSTCIERSRDRSRRKQEGDTLLNLPRHAAASLRRRYVDDNAR